MSFLSCFMNTITNSNFLERSVETNRIVLRTGAVVTLGIEAFNMFRVIVLSNSGLETLNNSIYFGFYLFYFLCCLLFLILDFKLKSSIKVRHRLYMVSGSIFLFWSTAFNIYDIYSSDAVGNFTIITATIIFSAFFIIKPLYALINLGLSSAIFIFFLYRIYSSGEAINFLITVLLCVVVYFVRYYHLCVELSQSQKLNNLSQELYEIKRGFQLSAEQHELIREKVSYVTFEWNIRKDWIRFSKEWSEWFGQPQNIPEFSTYISNLKVITPEQKNILSECLEKAKEGAAFQKLELLLPLKAGGNGWFDLKVVTQTNKHGEPIFGIGMLTDITDEKEKINQLEKELTKDLFTGVLNKTSIERYGKKKIKQLNENEILAVLILDIDNFKSINDTFGHPVGDHVLKETAALIQRYAPHGAKVGRIGGDEFAVLFVTDNLLNFYSYGKILLDEVSKIKYSDIEIHVSCSIGISAADIKEGGYLELYKKADQALYHAKSMGKRQIYCYGKYCPDNFKKDIYLT